MKKNIIIALLSFCIIGLAIYIGLNSNENQNSNSDIQGQGQSGIQDETPIDSYYKEKLEMSLSTVEINYVADRYMNAWKKEFEHVVQIIKENLNFEQDKENLLAMYNVIYRKHRQLYVNNFDIFANEMRLALLIERAKLIKSKRFIPFNIVFEKCPIIKNTIKNFIFG